MKRRDVMLKKNNYQPCSLHKRVAASVEDFAPLPSVAMKVLGMVADPDTTSTEIELVLKGDISLVVSVLKLANPAFYGLRRQVVSLGHALLLLGRNEVQGLLLSRVMFQAFKVSEGQQKDIMAGVWKHSLECALAAEYLSEKYDADMGVCFLGGMLHDVGKLVIVQQFSAEVKDLEKYGQLTEEDGVEAEIRLLGCSHNDLGSQLLHRWMFPAVLVEMVQSHHSYEEIAEYDRPRQVLIVANILSRLVAAKDHDEIEEDELEVLTTLLLRCGADSGIISDENSLIELEAGFRQRLAERQGLIELLEM